MGLHAPNILMAVSLGLGYAGATSTAVGAGEIAVIGESTALCLDSLAATLIEPSKDVVNVDCGLSESAQELSDDPLQLAKPIIIGSLAVATAAAITGTKRQTDIKVRSFRWSPIVFKRRVP